ncbi:oxidoreductase [Staphylococcus felis]|uniref:oxidoreductase n=1 Tax=Staphylococcus felis TaxID=46127 RepID=UPI000CD19C55|nr:oxidoreductase [Staphylococcus felis]AVP35881.1 oxidoreductase [Staphylococcus felis]PNZ36200.1 2-dehydropantoate 2-reductase [Staphylococcus felis]QQB04140.1 oxidoreductase [Staphylococcus felis]
MTKIAIIGAGAVGTSLAVALQKHSSVTLLGRHTTSITYEEAQTSKKQDIKVHALSSESGQFDVIWIAVKTYQLSHVIPHLNRIAHPNTIVILAQNGYGQLDQLASYRAYQAVVYISGQKKDNHVVHFRDQTIHIQRDTHTEQLAETLSHTELTLHLEENIECKIWYKLLVNLGINTVTALGRDTARVLKHHEMHTLCRKLLIEGQHIAQAEGITFHSTLVDEIMAIYQGYPDEMGTSMYYDTINHQPLEVDAIQGYLYHRAQHHQIHTPYLETTYTLLTYQNKKQGC